MPHTDNGKKSNNRPMAKYKKGETDIDAVKNNRDLGVILQHTLNLDKNKNKIFGNNLLQKA